MYQAHAISIAGRVNHPDCVRFTHAIGAPGAVHNLESTVTRVRPTLTECAVSRAMEPAEPATSSAAVSRCAPPKLIVCERMDCGGLPSTKTIASGAAMQELYESGEIAPLGQSGFFELSIAHQGG